LTDPFLAAMWTRIRALANYLERRSIAGPEYLRSMIEPSGSGVPHLSDDDRRDALRIDTTLRRVGVRCLWRSAIVTEHLRARGVMANIGITVSARDPSLAHAECEVDGVPLRPYASDSVRLR
jgi:hypothetical protein